MAKSRSAALRLPSKVPSVGSSPCRYNVQTRIQLLSRSGRAASRSCIADLWRGVATAVTSDGSVSGIYSGGPIYPTLADYLGRPHTYVASACGGLGAVLSSIAAAAKYFAAAE